MDEYGAMVEWYWQGKTEVLARNPISVLHHHASLVRGQEVTFEPWNDLNLMNVKNAFIELYLILYVNAGPFLTNASLLLYTEGAVLCDKGEIRYVFEILIYERYKVKWSHYRPGVAQRVGRGIALLFHDHGTRRGWVVSSTLRPHFTSGKDPVPILQEAGWVPVPVWTGGKSRPHRDLIPDRPACCQSLYRLSYPAYKF